MKKIFGFSILFYLILLSMTIGGCKNSSNNSKKSDIFITMIPIIKYGEKIIFQMGSSEQELKEQAQDNHPDYYTYDEQPLHEITLSIPYAMNKYETTCALFCEVMNWAIDKGYALINKDKLTDPSGKFTYLSCVKSQDFMLIQHNIIINKNHIQSKDGLDNHPAHNVSWYGAVAFCNFLSEKEGLDPVYDLKQWTWDKTKTGYRLPTEAEWDYAARGKTRNAYSYGDDYDFKRGNSQASYHPFDTVTMPVGFYDGKTKNDIKTKNGASPMGLYDMTGNVWEWCWDWYSKIYYGQSQNSDPSGPDKGDDRPPYDIGKPTKVWRGCGWAGALTWSRVEKRWSASPNSYFNEVGFRIVRTLQK